METTIIIAQVLGVYFLVSGVFVATHGKTFGQLVKDLFENRALTYVVGMLLVFGGATLVLTQDYGTDPLSIFVMVMSWAILIKGATYILAPQWLYGMSKQFSRSTVVMMGFVLAALGIYLVFFLN